jgi:hypothetical protein
MLTITIPGVELYNEEENLFYIDPNKPTVSLRIEHSLRSVADWESKWKKPFFSSTINLTELRDYVRFMTLNREEIPEEVYSRIGGKELREIQKYINDPYTATTFGDSKQKTHPKRRQQSGKFMTAEIIYYYMVMLEIPFEADRWNLNRLMTLIRVCQEKQAPQEKKTKRELSSKFASLNAQRLAANGGRG